MRTFGLGMIVWLVAVGFSPSQADDRRADTTKLTVMTFNGEFLWDGRQPEEGQVEFSWKGSPDEADERMKAIADIIAEHDPDIVNLVEVEGLPALERLNTFLPGRGYVAYLVQGTDTFTGQDVGLLTRIDPVDGEIHRDDRKGSSGGVQKAVSKNYFAKLNVGERKVALLGVHYLARPLDESRLNERQAQAEATRLQALELAAAGHEIIVMGDLNDYTGDPTSLDVNDHMPITDVVARLQGMDPGTPDDDLVNAHSRVAKALRYTSHWDKDEDSHVDAPEEFSAIDHMLISGSLARLIDWVAIDHDHDPLKLTDHYPIIVRLNLQAGDEPPVPPPAAAIVTIDWLLPNPEGDEQKNEAAAVRNAGPGAVSMVGWTLKDAAGKTWKLDTMGELAEGQSTEIVRKSQAMALNNNGDRVDLVDPSGMVRHSVSYEVAEEGEVLDFE